MHRLLLASLVLLTAAATAPIDRSSDRETLLVADRALANRAAALGLLQGVVPSMVSGGAYLYPGAPLLRGTDKVREYFQRMPADSIVQLTWSPAFADVSADGQLGYSYGWTRAGGGAAHGKYLACWRKLDGDWRLVAYASNKPIAVTDSVPAWTHGDKLGPQVRGSGDPRQLLQADSAFAALSLAQGAKAAFVAYAAEAAMAFGGGAQFTEGRDAIGANFDNFPAGAQLAWWPVGAELAGSGDLGCTVGEASIASLNHYSKYLTIWKRQTDNSWKFVADGGSVRPAP